jgi:hypothetical protein
MNKSLKNQAKDDHSSPKELHQQLLHPLLLVLHPAQDQPRQWHYPRNQSPSKELRPRSLQGTAPTIFTGERSLSETFMRDFKIYKIMNPLADVMKQPYARIATALSLIRGPKVDDWVDEQLRELEQNV